MQARAEAALVSGELDVSRDLATRLSAQPPGPWDSARLSLIILAKLG